MCHRVAVILLMVALSACAAGHHPKHLPQLPEGSGEELILESQDREDPAAAPQQPNLSLTPRTEDTGGFNLNNTFVSSSPTFDATRMALRIKREMAGLGVVGFSYAISRSGKLLVSGGQGWARAPWEGKPSPSDPSRQPSIPMTERTKMMIASISKPITAAALMNALEENSSISVDDPFYPLISQRFPDAGDGVDKVTIRQLLTHTSGLATGAGCSTSALADLLQEKAGAGNYDYENSNFCLIRQLIESITGEDYLDYVQREVLNPMTITSMSCLQSTDNPALYYHAASAEARALGVRFGDFTDRCSAYGWYGSAIDIAKFLAHFRFDTVLEEGTRRDMISGRLGWFPFEGGRGTYYMHNGSWFWRKVQEGGFLGVGMGFPDEVDAVLLTNTRTEDTFVVVDILARAYEAAFD